MSVAEPLSLYLDSNVFIDALEGELELAAFAQHVLRLAALKKVRAYSSELTLAEVLIKPQLERRSDLVRSYIALFGPKSAVSLQPVSRSILVESARYRATVHRNKPPPGATRRNFLPDAIHVVTAIDVRASVYFGRDTRLRLPEGMDMIEPNAVGIASLDERLA